MITIQKYILIFIIVLAAVIVLVINPKYTFQEIPKAIGDPLELMLIQNTKDFNLDFYKELKGFLSTDIGPSPQPERLLKLISVNDTDFRGILKRHQNLLFISKSDSFQINIHKNVFAEGQKAIYIKCPSYDVLKNKKAEIIQLSQVIKTFEIRRMEEGFNNFRNKDLIQKINQSHNMSIILPKDFFLAYGDTSVTWVRRETPKISQGIVIANLATSINTNNTKPVRLKIDSIIKKHVFGPMDNSYMKLEKDAPILLDSVTINTHAALREQSLWRMENDFMGGIYNAYYFNNANTNQPIIIYTYLYAPGERKSISLLQLEAIINTISF